MMEFECDGPYIRVSKTVYIVFMFKHNSVTCEQILEGFLLEREFSTGSPV